MIDPKVHGTICDAVAGFIGDNDEGTVANAVIGALATEGFAIVPVNAEVLQRVLAEMSKKT